MAAGTPVVAGRRGAVGRRALFLRYVRPFWGQLLWLALVLLSTIALQLVNPQILQYYIDTAEKGGSVHLLTDAALLFLGVVLAAQIVTVVETYIAENLGWAATNRLREDLALHCLRLDLSFHHEHTPGEMIERIDGDVTQLANYFSRFVVYVVGNLLLLVGVIVMLLRVDWRIALAFAALTVITMIGIQRVQRFAVPYTRVYRQASAELYGFIEEWLAGTEDIRANGAAAYAGRRLLASLRRNNRTQWVARTIAGLSGFLFFASWGAISGLTFGLGTHLVQIGALSIGTLYLVYAYSQVLLQPILSINDHLQDFQAASASMGRIAELLGTESAIGGGLALTAPAGALSVQFEQVSYRYGDGPTVLHDLSFRLEPGKVMGILGRTGSGKTTITALLTRFYDPVEGTVRVGGMDLRKVEPADLRRRVGLVTQHVQLFHASVRDNLTFFDRAVSDQRLRQVLDEIGLGEWYRTLPVGLDTVLAAGGGNLSAGEAQLLAFARVFLKDPGLVILDEASSRLDPATERLIERAIDQLLAGRTGIIVAHRLETLRRADEILILEDGRIRERGPRAMLESDPRSRFAELLRQGRPVAPP
jgi:ATP-binding cassette subfamily B protein